MKFEMNTPEDLSFDEVIAATKGSFAQARERLMGFETFEEMCAELAKPVNGSLEIRDNHQCFIRNQDGKLEFYVHEDTVQIFDEGRRVGSVTLC